MSTRDRNVDGTPADASLEGFQVRGRHGVLGTVSQHRRGSSASGMLIVTGGASQLLRYHLPVSSIRAVAPRAGTITVDLDVADFLPRSSPLGEIDLFLPARSPDEVAAADDRR